MTFFSTPGARRGAAAIVIASLALAACGSEDSSVRPEPPPPPVIPDPPVAGVDFSQQQVLVAINDSSSAGTVSALTGAFAAAGTTLQTRANEGIAQDRAETLYHAGDGDTPGIAVLCESRESTAFSATKDRRVTPNVGAIKGIEVVGSRGWIIAADFGAQMIRVYSNNAGGSPAPLFETGVGSTSVWDVLYDEANDRLFAALTNGRVGVYDQFSAFSASGPNRTFRASNSVNFHGIALDSANNRLVVSDVGSAADSTDGAIYVFDNASSAQGLVTPAVEVRGPATQLGNPVDIQLDGNILRIAEKAGNLLLAYGDIFSATGDQEPDLSVANTRPESLLTRSPMAPDLPPDVSDLDVTTALSAVLVTQNPMATRSTNIVGVAIDEIEPNPGSFTVNLLNGSLGDNGTFTVGTAADARYLESISIDLLGNAYMSFDNGQDTTNQPPTGSTNVGGLLIAERLFARSGQSATTTRDRVIAGAATGLVSPKGVEVVREASLMIVADTRSTDYRIAAFSLCASGNVAPLFSTSNLGPDAAATTAIWDIDYDPSNDRLFAAATDGTVLVYDNFVDNEAADAPARVITPFDSNGEPAVNLHGIAAVVGGDTPALIVSDVGSAADATDGKVFVLTGDLATLQGDVAVTAEYSGNGLLGNPVDLAFDGSDVYVAEKSNDMLLRFDDVLSQTGLQSGSPSAMVSQTKPESVVLVPTFTGG